MKNKEWYLEFLSPMLISLNQHFNLNLLDEEDIYSIKKVEGDSSFALVVHTWRGEGKNWSIFYCLDNEVGFNNQLQNNRKDNYDILIFKKSGEVYSLTKEEVIINYNLRKIWI